MSKAKPADQAVEVLCWLHPSDAAIIHEAANRGEGSRSGIIRECVALCLHFGLRPWRALQARAHAENALRMLDEMENGICAATLDERDLLSLIAATRADLRAAYLPDGETPHHRLRTPPEAGPGKG
jgi:hypothetical protein